MKVSEVLANATNLTSQVIKIEGWVTQDNKEIYIWDFNNDAYHSITLERPPRQKTQQPPTREEAIKSLLAKFGSGHFKGISQSQAEHHYHEFKRTRDVNHLDFFTKMGAGQAIAELVYDSGPSTTLYSELSGALFEMRLSEDRDNVNGAEGYVLAEIQSLEDDSSQWIAKNPLEVELYHKDYICLIKRDVGGLEQINLGSYKSVPVIDILTDAPAFHAQRVEIQGVLADAGMCFIVPNYAYLKLEDPRERVIKIPQSPFLNKFRKNLSPMLGGRFSRVVDARIVGVVYVGDKSHSIRLLDITAAATKNDGIIHRWKL